jgi:hypothetical protein
MGPPYMAKQALAKFETDSDLATLWPPRHLYIFTICMGRKRGQNLPPMKSGQESRKKNHKILGAFQFLIKRAM